MGRTPKLTTRSARLRRQLKIVAILGLVAGCMNLVYAILGAMGIPFAASYVDNLQHSEISGPILQTLGGKALLWISAIMTAILIIPDAFLLHGINKKKPGFMFPWLIMKMILVVLFTIWSIAFVGVSFMALLFANTVLRDESSNQNSLTDLVDLSNQRNESFGSAVNGIATLVIIVYATGLAIANALAYYIWDIVKSAYKQIKEENHMNQHAIPYEMTSRNTYEQKPQAYAPV